MPNGIINKCLSLVSGNFHKWYGLGAALLLTLVVTLSMYALLPSGRVRFLWYGFGILFLLLCILLFWTGYTFRYPKRKKNRLGLAIAIQTENLKDLLYLQKDFLNPLKVKIDETQLPFDFLIAKPHQAEGIVSIEDARAFLKRTKAHFCLWGSVKNRHGKYSFELRGFVVHRPIQEVQQVLLRNEFSAMLPNKVAFEESLQLDQFGFRAEQVFAAVDYITGRAALLSGDFNLAIKLHESLLNSLAEENHLPIERTTLNKILSVEYDLKAAVEYLNNGFKEAYVLSVQKSLVYNPNNYGALLKKAIVEFADGEGDPVQALRTIKQAKKYSMGSHWLYSLIFLLLWTEDYPKALFYLDKLKKKTYPGEEQTIVEVVNFNVSLLSRYNKPQLYYWLGFIAFEKSQNVSLADKYFQQFVDLAPLQMGDLRKLAEEYLIKIKDDIGY